MQQMAHLECCNAFEERNIDARKEKTQQTNKPDFFLNIENLCASILDFHTSIHRILVLARSEHYHKFSTQSFIIKQFVLINFHMPNIESDLFLFPPMHFDG